MYDNKLYLSPRYTLEVCKEIFLNLGGASTEERWLTAIEIFEDRMNARFFEAISLLSDRCEERRGHNLSFSIMGLNCLLIETLQQFYDGVDQTASNHANAFRRFFTNSPHFKLYFNDEISRRFYKDVRCGILHQAQTKNNVALEFNENEMVRYAENGWLVFNVKAINHALYSEFQDYLSKLRSPNQVNLRSNFVKKMIGIVLTADEAVNSVV